MTNRIVVSIEEIRDDLAALYSDRIYYYKSWRVDRLPDMVDEYSYSLDFLTQDKFATETPDRLLDIPHCSGSDYTCGVMCEVNRDTLEEEWENLTTPDGYHIAQFYYGPYNTYGVVVNIDMLNAEQMLEVLDVLKKLEMYPSLNDEETSNRELELAEEAVNDYLVRDFLHELANIDKAIREADVDATGLEEKELFWTAFEANDGHFEASLYDVIVYPNISKLAQWVKDNKPRAYWKVFPAEFEYLFFEGPSSEAHPRQAHLDLTLYQFKPLATCPARWIVEENERLWVSDGNTATDTHWEE